MSNFRVLLLYLPVPVLLLFCLYYGVPIVKDANETFQSYTHAWNLIYSSPLEFSFLTANGVRGDIYPYTHNPNLPRYFHALFLLAGIDDITVHVAAICSVCAALTIFFISRLFDIKTATLLVFLTALDWVGSQYFFNTYRAWSFVLFWGCLWAVNYHSKCNNHYMLKCSGCWIAFAAFFILFQYEYGFAIFVAVTALLFCDRWRVRFAAIGGAAASLLFFAVQVVSHLGFDGVIAELSVTAARRTEWKSWGGNYAFYQTLVWTVAFIALVFIRRHGLGRLYAAMLGGAITVIVILQQYVQDAFLSHGIPFLTFFIIVAFSLLGRRMGQFAILLVPLLVINSIYIWKAFPPMERGYVEAVRNAGGPVVSPGSFYGFGFALNPISGEPTHELCLARPWQENRTCDGRPFSVTPLPD